VNETAAFALKNIQDLKNFVFWASLSLSAFSVFAPLFCNFISFFPFVLACLLPLTSSTIFVTRLT